MKPSLMPVLAFGLLTAAAAAQSSSPDRKIPNEITTPDHVETRIGSLEYVFNLAVPAAKVKWLGLDPQAAFLLSLVDGQTNVAEVLELCQMGRLEALRVFTELLEAKAIVRVA